MTKQNLATALTQRLHSNVRDVTGHFEKMLKPCGGQDKFPFSLRMVPWWPAQHRGGVRKSVFPCQKVSSSCHKEAQRRFPFLSYYWPNQKGWENILTYKTKH